MAVLSAILTLFLLAVQPARPRAHGMMCTPRQRGAYRSVKCGSDLRTPPNPVTDHCAHCLNGGTVATVAQHLPKRGWRMYDPVRDFDATADRAGLCGDAKGHADHMIGGDFFPPAYRTVPFVAHWRTGAHVDMLAEIDTNHNGYFEFFLCDLSGCGSHDIAARCFKQGFCHRLLRVPHPDCEDRLTNTHYECGPIDDRYPGRWYLPCRNTGHVGVHIVGGPSGTMRYRLPTGVRCRHCVLQWYWATANSCAPPGLVDYMTRLRNPFGTTCESDGGGRGTFRRGMDTCGDDRLPEEFWSCADVQVTDDGRSAGAVRAVGIKQPPRPKRSGDDVVANPKGVFDKAKDEMENDIETEAREPDSERERERHRAAKGDCMLEGDRCDGTVLCCDIQQVCVFSARSVGFSCRFWWSLWDEVEFREMSERKKSGRRKSS